MSNGAHVPDEKRRPRPERTDENAPRWEPDDDQVLPLHAIIPGPWQDTDEEE